MNISFYYGCQKGHPVNIQNIEQGNPGIGGTQYLIFLLAYYLSQDSAYSVHLVGTREISGLDNVCCHNIEEESHLKKTLDDIDTDILITYHFPNTCLVSDLYNANFKIIVWSHNFLRSNFCDYIVKNKSIKCNVFVGKQQYDWYIDDDVIKKSLQIYNMMPDVLPEGIRKNDSRSVVFMGLRGILQVCQCWKKVIEAVPDAVLYIIGSDNLYEKSQLGKLGIAKQETENSFLPYISDENGDVLPSVHFLGLLNESKTDYFCNSSVGIINPSGCHETFGMGVVEMGVAELPVVTSTSNGYYDTVVSGKTGFICKSVDELSDKIIYLLTHPQINETMGKNGKDNAKRFSPQIIVPKWKSLINDVYADNLSIQQEKASTPYTLDFKYIRIINRFLRFNLHLSFLPSLIKVQCAALNLINHLRAKSKK